MSKIIGPLKAIVASAVLFAFLTAGLPTSAQDLVPVSDVTGGSSVFVFRKSSKGSPQRFVSRQRTRRSTDQRKETAKKINKQYETLAKVAPRRIREKVVDPENLPSAIRIKSMPRDEASRLFAGVGEYYIDKTDSDNAIKFFRESLDLDPKNTVSPKGLSEALALKGNELLAKDEGDKAKAHFDEALKYNPNNAVAFYGLGELYAGKDLDAESIANYEKAIRTDRDLTEIYVPLGILYYQAGEIAKADELLSKAVTVDPDSAEAQYYLGLVRYTQNKNPDALTAFRNATRLKPDYAEAYYYAGETLERLGKPTDAVVEYQKALANKAVYFEPALSLGSAFYELERWPESIAAYEKAVKLKNDNIQAYINLGDAYRQTRNFEKAESNYNLAVSFIERAKDYDRVDAADTYNKIGFVIAQQCPINMSKALPCRWDSATRSLEKAVALTTDNVDYANLGWAYYNAAKKDFVEHRDALGREKLEKAKVNLQRAVGADSRYLNAPMVNLGMALNDLGEYKSAADVLNRVVQREPKWTFAMNELGMAYYGMKDYKNAINRFNDVIKRDAKYSDAYFNLGKAQFDNGNVGEAKKAYQSLRKIGANMYADRLDRETGGAMARQ